MCNMIEIHDIIYSLFFETFCSSIIYAEGIYSKKLFVWNNKNDDVSKVTMH